jgi:6,7-dimethyl-8-ribityllumazine synthase
MQETKNPHILIIKATFYDDIADRLEEGAIEILDSRKASYDIVEVPGALEIPVALSLACDAGLLPFGANRWKYHGCVDLVCVIRGQTSHYEIVANESSRALLDIAISHHLPIGNGILTVENREQALVRVRRGEGHKGAVAANACLQLIDHMRNWYKIG